MPMTITRQLLDIGVRSFGRFIELGAFDRSMALAGQAFAALLPLLIVCGTTAPGDDLANELIDRYRLSGSAADTLRTAVAQPPDTGISAIGVVLLVISALSFTRALQRLYVNAWRLEKLGVRGNGWGLAWLALFVGFWSLQPVIVGVFDGVVAFTVSIALSTLLWLWTPWLLVARRIAWRRLLPQAFLTTVGLAGVTIAAAIYLPRAFASASEQFGILGVAFTLLSLLFALSFVLVAAAALGATLVEPPALGLRLPTSEQSAQQAAHAHEQALEQPEHPGEQTGYREDEAP
jgi:membrane protein